MLLKQSKKYMNKILLTGGEGFIGKYFQMNLMSKGISFFSYDLSGGYDIRDKYELDFLMDNEKFDTVINLAARTGVKWGEEYPEEFTSVNVEGLQNIVDLCQKYNTRLIHFSSSSVFKKSDKPLKETDWKEPISYYGTTKLIGEILIKMANIDYTIIRPFTVLGRRGRPGMIIDRWMSQIEKKEAVTFYGDGKTYRGYTYVEDLIEGVLASKPGEYNLGGDQVITLEEMWNIFKDVYPRAERNILPLPVFDVYGSVADTSKAFNDFGWKHKTDLKKKIREWIK